MRKLFDTDNSELSGILATLLAEDVQITAREVARRHSVLKDASAFTRNEARAFLIADAQQRQSDARNVKTDPLVKQVNSAADTLAARRDDIARLEQQVKSLVASHVGCIRAVVSSGGMAALERFWKEYKSVADTVQALGALAATGVVVQLQARPQAVPVPTP